MIYVFIICLIICLLELFIHLFFKPITIVVDFKGKITEYKIKITLWRIIKVYYYRLTNRNK